ncbi:DUF397 domain-containing protein [Streptomyces sp. NPDC059851]|uniref:DUF397 domain-containing protein n=1 Tax=Streptomyces sp. NPDC059851 TaxID=3346971 RepID=UPI00365B4915
MSIKLSAEGLSALTWTKSSYSTNDGPACVEIAWTKSSHSTTDGSAYVGAAHLPGTILVRDSKVPHGGRLALSPAAWAGFVAAAGA